MRTKVMLALSVIIFAALNYGIYQKEEIKTHGTTMLMKLAPVDPRSLMQGDYMRLRYAIGSTVSQKELESYAKRGFLVVKTDEDNVAQFVRLYEGKTLLEGETLLRFHTKYNRARIVPDSFFFQEGHAKSYEVAKYGIFKFDGSGNHLLVGLADKDRQEIIGSVEEQN